MSTIRNRDVSERVKSIRNQRKPTNEDDYMQGRRASWADRLNYIPHANNPHYPTNQKTDLFSSANQNRVNGYEDASRPSNGVDLLFSSNQNADLISSTNEDCAEPSGLLPRRNLFRHSVMSREEFGRKRGKLNWVQDNYKTEELTEPQTEANPSHYSRTNHEREETNPQTNPHLQHRSGINGKHSLATDPDIRSFLRDPPVDKPRSSTANNGDESDRGVVSDITCLTSDLDTNSVLNGYSTSAIGSMTPQSGDGLGSPLWPESRDGCVSPASPAVSRESPADPPASTCGENASVQAQDGKEAFGEDECDVGVVSQTEFLRSISGEETHTSNPLANSNNFSQHILDDQSSTIPNNRKNSTFDKLSGLFNRLKAFSSQKDAKKSKDDKLVSVLLSKREMVARSDEMQRLEHGRWEEEDLQRRNSRRLSSSNLSINKKSNLSLHQKNDGLSEKAQKEREKRKSVEARLEAKRNEMEAYQASVRQRQEEDLQRASSARYSKQQQQLLKAKLRNVQQEQRMDRIQQQNQQSSDNLHQLHYSLENKQTRAERKMAERRREEVEKSRTDLHLRIEQSKLRQQQIENEIRVWQEELQKYSNWQLQQAEASAKEAVLRKKKMAANERMEKEKLHRQNLDKILASEEQRLEEMEQNISQKEETARRKMQLRQQQINKNREIAALNHLLRDEIRSSGSLVQLDRQTQLQHRVIFKSTVDNSTSS